MNSHVSTYTAQPADEDLIDEFQANLQLLDACDLECDGLTFALGHALERAGIRHRRMVGYVSWYPGKELVVPHCWIELGGGYVIDFRLRMWLGNNENVPHGIFWPCPFEIRYYGEPQKKNLPSSEVLNIMTDGRLSKLNLQHLELPSYVRLDQ